MNHKSGVGPIYFQEILIAISILVSLVAAFFLLYKAEPKSSVLPIALSFFLLSLRELARLVFFYNQSFLVLKWSLLLEPITVSLLFEGCAHQFVEQSRKIKNAAIFGLFSIIGSILWALAGLYWPVFSVTGADRALPRLVIGSFEKSGAVFILVVCVGLLWRLENILRQSERGLRWRVKYAVLGLFIICGNFIWDMGYRLSYLELVPEQFAFSSLVLITGLGFFMFAVIRFKLFRVEVFVSRYIVYHSVAILGAGLYLTILGIITVVIRYTKIPLPQVAWHIFFFLAAVVFVVVAISQDVRNKVRFFINTHFFANKYDYRREWVEYSRRLLDVKTEKEIVTRLEDLLLETMFIKWVAIWVGDERSGYREVAPERSHGERSELSGSHPLIHILKNSSFLLFSDRYGYVNEEGHVELSETAFSFLEDHQVSLAVPLIVREKFLGFVGVGPEYTKTEYGRDDIDLLQAFASQTATAINMVRLREKIVQSQKLYLFNKLSIFVMHDLKNAASLLSLILQNAPQHIHEQEFQNDLLESVSAACQRLEKVMTNLKTLKREEPQKLESVDISVAMKEHVKKFQNACPDIVVRTTYKDSVFCRADKELLNKSIENLLMNARDALEGTGEIRIEISGDTDKVYLTISDNGPGISSEFMKKNLFKPFKTTKEKGLGIGLWQVKSYLDAMGGKIEVESEVGKGTTFKIILESGEPSVVPG